MTIEEYNAKLGTMTEEYAQRAVDSIYVPAANMLLATIKNRIEEGKNSQDSKTGAYSTKPAYYSPEAFVKRSTFAAQGKTGEKVFKNGKPHKTEFFPSGYKGLRDKQGRRTDVMNMNYSGGTMLAYQMQVGKDAILLGMTNKEAADIRKGQEKKRGRIFSATQQEIEAYNKEIFEETEKLTVSYLK